MSTPTEAYYDLRRHVIFSDPDDGAELIANSEARAVAAAVTALTCTHHNDLERAACPVCLVTALTAERDQLRAELEKVYLLVTPVGFDLPGGIFETAQAVTELRAERDLLCRCLRGLVDEQNGAPLELRRTQWQAAMDEALSALTKTEDAT